MKIINVDSKKEYRQFIKTPVSIFHGHPLYVPPLWMDELKGYDKKNNPI
ncbi:MAG: GTP cyclohydrolase, partial [Clostridiaceae bacterium]|nr:GTP cyclohydrolase [Clostridiaceae bacterium]